MTSDVVLRLPCRTVRIDYGGEIDLCFDPRFPVHSADDAFGLRYAEGVMSNENNTDFLYTVFGGKVMVSYKHSRSSIGYIEMTVAVFLALVVKFPRGDGDRDWRKEGF